LEERIVILILAAGPSHRFGKPKQLLDYKGKTVVENAIDQAIKSNVGPVIVVTGANYTKIEKVIKKQDSVMTVHNPSWNKGLSFSIQKGLNFARKSYPNLYGMLVMLCDQPLITYEHIVDMVRSHYAYGKKIIASGYGGSYGVPVFFHKTIFGYLEKITEKDGAKSIISKLKQDVHVIPNPDAEFDIDTPDDYKKLLKMK
jgi:molybdenum cofactor cytidylyltransferase